VNLSVKLASQDVRAVRVLRLTAYVLQAVAIAVAALRFFERGADCGSA
jgi:hypothetical protein